MDEKSLSKLKFCHLCPLIISPFFFSSHLVLIKICVILWKKRDLGTYTKIKEAFSLSLSMCAVQSNPLLSVKILYNI